MENLFKKLESKYNLDELQKIATILDKKYRFSIFFDGWSVLKELLFNPIDLGLEEYIHKYHYKDVFSNFIMKYGKNESIVKYYLTKEFIGNSEEVCMYEFPVLNSRADFVRVNGVSHAYEIKTEIDTLDRLKNQIADYLSAFEYVTVVVHIKHLKKVKSTMPRCTGIIAFEINNDGVRFEQVREAKENRSYKMNVQLGLLNSCDLGYIIKTTLGYEVPKFKNDRFKLVKSKHNKVSLNYAFKEALKNSRQKKWEHIKTNFDMLKPIEIQAAFSEIQ